MTAPEDRRAFASTNPATGEVLATFDTVSDEVLEEYLAVADARFRQWRETSVTDRAAVLATIADAFEAQTEQLARLATTEMGKTLEEAVGEVEFAVQIFRYYADHGPALVSEQTLENGAGGRAVIQKLPIGVLLGIMPWNFPFYQLAHFVAPNLLLGNTILLKHAESVPQSALAVQALLDQAALPSGAYQNLFVSYEQVETVIADSRVQGVSLTGSERAGSVVGALAGKHLKKSVLELGGSDPYVVLDGADVAQAAKDAWDARNDNAGQACNSNKRIIVSADIFDEFVSTLTERARGLRPGDPAEGADGTYPPLVNRAAAENPHELVQDAVAAGATLHAGGELADGPVAYYSPAVLTGVTPQMRAYREELFGPVAVVYSVASDEEALALANDTPYGLGGAVFSTDEERARTLAARLEVGMAHVNTWAGEGAEVPFGGVKRSGFGRELGPLGVDEFANKRLFWVQ